MEITGKLIQIVDPITGESKSGTWKKQEFIFETDEDYSRKICVTNWNDKISPDSLETGESYTVSVNVESREYNGRWYTDLKMWKVEKMDSTQNPKQQEPAKPAIQNELEEPDDLPF